MYRPRLLVVALCLLTAAPVFAQDDDLDVSDMLQEASALLQSQDFEKAAEWFQKVVKADPDNGRAWQLLGYSLHAAGKLDKAIPAHQKAAEFDQFKGVALYNLGCAYSLKGDKAKSLAYLNKAVDADFKDVSYFETDPDLDNVRSEREFKKIMARVKGTDAPEMRDEDDKPAKKGPNLAGTWVMKKGMRSGAESERMPPSVKVTKDAFTIPTEDPNQSFVMAYELDRSKKPMHIDFKIKEGPADGTAKGIVKIEKGTMTLCYHPMGETRPTEFKSTEENGNFMFVLQRKPRKLNAARLVGKWNVESGSRAGSEVAQERLSTDGGVSFTKDTITLPAGPDTVFVMKYEINSDAQPVEIDMEIKSGPAPEGSKALGIIRMKEGKLMLCYDSTGGQRPTKFKTTEQDGNFMFTLQRVKAKKKPAKKKESDKQKVDK